MVVFFTRLGSVTEILVVGGLRQRGFRLRRGREALALKKGRGPSWLSARTLRLCSKKKIGPGWRCGIRWGEAVASETIDSVGLALGAVKMDGKR
ncbi:hypothetical protein AVEN_62008-1 [Araneus ventricosus]|uniref:Uncharacterized protein n=1 Tax=Araneus ventricosus TaxID=182803 RepID=A0A4Y2EAD3_ARAVE|nr:hypothetical protein AVEN_62008-1 [Araneus ventricosus]